MKPIKPLEELISQSYAWSWLKRFGDIMEKINKENDKVGDKFKDWDEPIDV